MGNGRVLYALLALARVAGASVGTVWLADHLYQAAWREMHIEYISQGRRWMATLHQGHRRSFNLCQLVVRSRQERARA